MRKYTVLLCFLIMLFIFSPEILALEIKESIDVRVDIPFYLTLDISFFVDEEPVGLGEGEGLLFREDMIIDALGEVPFPEDNDDLFRMVVEYDYPLEINVAGNFPHQILILSDFAFFSGPEGNQIPIEKLEWRKEDGHWQPLRREAAEIVIREEPGKSTERIEFRLWVDIEDEIGVYEGNIVFAVKGLR